MVLSASAPLPNEEAESLVFRRRRTLLKGVVLLAKVLAAVLVNHPSLPLSVGDLLLVLPNEFLYLLALRQLTLGRGSKLSFQVGSRKATAEYTQGSCRESVKGVSIGAHESARTLRVPCLAARPVWKCPLATRSPPLLDSSFG